MSRLPAMLQITAMLVVAIMVVFSGSTASKTYLGKPGRASGTSVAPLDDGWRRTAVGWERASQWDLPHAVANTDEPLKERYSQSLSDPLAAYDVSLIRFALHPAWLACVLLVSVGAGFVLFPSLAREERLEGPSASPSVDA